MDRSPAIHTCNICGANSLTTMFYRRVSSRCAECHRTSVRKNRAEKADYYRAYDAKRFKEQPQRKAKNEAYAKSEHGRKVLGQIKKKWATLNKVKRKAHIILGNAVRCGTVEKPSSCTVCGASGRRIHGHHHDYSKPLDVIWVCPPCHAEFHR